MSEYEETDSLTPSEKWEKIREAMDGCEPDASVDDDGSVCVSYWGKEKGHLVTWNFFKGGKVSACYSDPKTSFVCPADGHQ
jgi:hypothetical protein